MEYKLEAICVGMGTNYFGYELHNKRTKIILHRNYKIDICGNVKEAARSLFLYMIEYRNNNPTSKRINLNALMLDLSELDIDYNGYICSPIPESFTELREELTKLKKLMAFT